MQRGPCEFSAKWPTEVLDSGIPLHCASTEDTFIFEETKLFERKFKEGPEIIIRESIHT